MSVKVIHPHETPQYSVQKQKVRIEFKDGTFMIGFINLHSKVRFQEVQTGDSYAYHNNPAASGRFSRTSDYLKDCNQTEGMLTVFDAFYGGNENKVCFVFLHSVKYISEEP